MKRAANLVPNFLRPLLRPVLRAIKSSQTYRKMFHRPKSRLELHRYWRQPSDGLNLPRDYLEGEERSQFLLQIVRRFADPDARVLEIGCNVGRNLNYLFLSGFHNLEGIEISEGAVQLLRDSYPEMASQAKIHSAPVEEVVNEFSDNSFDVVFTMAVLEHIHADSEWIFPEIVRITRGVLITIEDEYTLSWRHFPRNYRKVFELLGMRQLEEVDCGTVKCLGSGFLARVLKKARSSSQTA